MSPLDAMQPGWSLDRQIESRIMGSLDAKQLDWSPERQIESG
jgi:hypothetical protein